MDAWDPELVDSGVLRKDPEVTTGVGLAVAAGVDLGVAASIEFPEVERALGVLLGVDKEARFDGVADIVMPISASVMGVCFSSPTAVPHLI